VSHIRVSSLVLTGVSALGCARTSNLRGQYSCLENVHVSIFRFNIANLTRYGIILQSFVN